MYLRRFFLDYTLLIEYNLPNTNQGIKKPTMNLDSVSEYFNLLGKEHAWIIQVFLVILASMVLNLFQKRLLRSILGHFRKTDNLWDDLLVVAAKKPLTLLIWLLGLTFAAEIVQKESDAAIFAAIDPIRDVGVIIILVMFFLNLIKGAEAAIINRKAEEGKKKADQHTVEAIGKLLIESVTPLTLEVALEVQQELEARFHETDKLRRQQVERAEYEANVAHRSFM